MGVGGGASLRGCADAQKSKQLKKKLRSGAPLQQHAAAMVRLKWEQLTVDEDFEALEEPAARRRGRRQAASAASASSSAAAAAAQTPPPPPRPSARRVLHHLAAGALAGATAKTVEAPLDRVKIIFQVSASRFSFRAAARQMVAIARNEGVQGLWKGNGAAAAGDAAGASPRGGAQTAICTLGPGRAVCLSQPVTPPVALRRRRDDDARRAVRVHQLRGARDAVAGAPPRLRARRAETRLAVVAPPPPLRTTWARAAPARACAPRRVAQPRTRRGAARTAATTRRGAQMLCRRAGAPAQRLTRAPRVAPLFVRPASSPVPRNRFLCCARARASG
jgi:hypothetical protein